MIVNGIEPPARPVEPVRLAAPDEFAVLCLARMQPEKRVDLFVRAVAAARRRDPRIRGFVAGDGDQRAQLERLAERSGVELLGERADTAALLAGADAFALTSEAEALPMSILEAMALGVPVVAPDLGGIADAVAYGETGLLAAPGDTAAIEAALLRAGRRPGARPAPGRSRPGAPARALHRGGDGGRLRGSLERVSSSSAIGRSSRHSGGARAGRPRDR